MSGVADDGPPDRPLGDDEPPPRRPSRSRSRSPRRRRESRERRRRDRDRRSRSGSRSPPPPPRGRSRSYSPPRRRRSRSRSWSRSRSRSPRGRRDRGGRGYRDDYYDRRGPPPPGYGPPDGFRDGYGRGGYGDPHDRRDYGPPNGRYGGPPGPYDGPPDGYGPPGGPHGGPPGPPPPRREAGRRRRDEGPPGVSLLIRNISSEMTTQDLTTAFARIGDIRDVYIPRDFHSQQPKGFAFIEYATPQLAAEAREEMDRFVIKGRELEVVFAQERRKTPNEMRGRVVDGPPGRRGDRGGGDRGRNFERSSSFERHMQREREQRGGGRPDDDRFSGEGRGKSSGGEGDRP